LSVLSILVVKFCCKHWEYYLCFMCWACRVG